jgi:Flp pilus assembly protein CpaB
MNRYQLAVSLGLALLGTLLLALYVRRLEHEVSAGPRVPVLAVRTNLPRGAVLAQDMLTLREVPGAYVERRAVRTSELDQAIGLRLESALEASDTLLWSDLATGVMPPCPSTNVLVGKQAYGVSLSGAGVSPLLRPGDYVDVYAGTGLLLQKVLVLAVGANTERDGPPAGDAHTLTLSLQPEQIPQLKQNESLGISVTLRNADDSSVILDPATRGPTTRADPVSDRPVSLWRLPTR